MEMAVQDYLYSPYYIRDEPLIVTGLFANLPSKSNAIQQVAEPESSENWATKITDLYPEVLVIIFSYLNVPDLGNAAQVCKLWRHVAYFKRLWRNVEVKLNLEQDCDHFSSLAERGIKKVQIQSYTQHVEKFMEVLVNLESLDFNGCNTFNDITLKQAFSNDLPHLISLNLAFALQLSDSAVSQIALNCKNLQELHLDGCRNITDCSLMLIAWGLKKLKFLSLRACELITNAGIKQIVGRSNCPLSDGNHCLESLVLQECPKITNAALKYISNGCMENLKAINLNFCDKITDIGLRYISKISGLRELKLRGCDKISDLGMVLLADGGSQIDILDISFCEKVTDIGITYVSQALDYVRVIKCTDDCLIGDRPIMPELANYGRLNRCRYY